MDATRSMLFAQPGGFKGLRVSESRAFQSRAKIEKLHCSTSSTNMGTSLHLDLGLAIGACQGGERFIRALENLRSHALRSKV